MSSVTLTPQNKPALEGLSTWHAHFNEAIEQYVQRLQLPEPLYAALRYTLINNGKRLRPLLVYATGSALGAKAAQLDSAAIAIELIHTYSLIHDDLPAMDDDDLRRGKPSCHKAFDEATAILAADLMQSLAYARLTDNNSTLTLAQQRQMVHLLATGSNHMVAGQVLDLQAEGKEVDLSDLQAIHHHKTGQLMTSAILLGATAAQADDSTQQQLRQFGDLIGLCFQIQDDILDIESSSEQLGKPQGSDAARQKATYPKLMGLDQAKVMAAEKLSAAQQILSDLPYDFELLKALAEQMLNRSH